MEALGPAFWIELVKYIGFPAVIFAIWYLYHKSQVEQMKKMMEEQWAREDRLIEILKDDMEHKTLLAGILSRLEVKLSQPIMCPLLERRQYPRQEVPNE